MPNSGTESFVSEDGGASPSNGNGTGGLGGGSSDAATVLRDS